MIFIVVGDVSLYMIGRRLAKGADQTDTEVSTPPTRWQRLASPERLEKVQGFFERYGSWSVFFGRFVAGVRGAVFLTAGMSGFPLLRFIILDGLAALLSVPLWIALGYWAGEHWEELLESAKSYQGYVLGGLILVALVVTWLSKRRADREVEEEIEEELQDNPQDNPQDENKTSQ
jgi:membrane protein DedA with SNARE-associated domain